VLSNLTLVGICFCCQNLGNLILGRFEKLSLPIEPKTPARTLRINEYVRGDKNMRTRKNTNANASAIVLSLEIATMRHNMC
jgi:hypothetical protein